MNSNISKSAPAACLAVIFSALSSPALAQEATVCRFQSVPSDDGSAPVAGTLVRTNQAALIEYENGAPASALICSQSPFHCEAKSEESVTTVDFSYPGFMVIVSSYPSLGITAIGLAKVACVPS